MASRRALLPLVLCVVAGLAMGCTEERGGGQGARNPVLTSHQFVTNGPAGLQMGEDCGAGGDASCAPATDGTPAVCLHSRPGINEGYVCSRPCSPEQPCPENWSCQQVIPNQSLCIPTGGSSGSGQ